MKSRRPPHLDEFEDGERGGALVGVNAAQYAVELRVEAAVAEAEQEAAQQSDGHAGGERGGWGGGTLELRSGCHHSSRRPAVTWAPGRGSSPCCR